MTGKAAAPARSAPSAPAPSPARTPVTRQLALVFAGVLLIAGGWLADMLVRDISGPFAVATGDAGIAVLAPGQLLKLSRDGTLESVDETVLPAEAKNGGLAWSGNALFVSPGPDNALVRCEGDTCQPFTTDTYGPIGPTHVFFDGTLFWFSETETERIQRYDAAGKRIDMPVSDLLRPGSLFVRDDQLYVANTGDGRLLRYTLHRRGVDDAETFVAWGEGNGKARIYAPLRFVPHPDGGFRAIFTDRRREHGLLARISAEGDVEPLRVEGLVNPVDLALLDGDMLVVDEDAMQLLKVGEDGKAAPFGNDELQATLAARHTERTVLRAAVPVLGVLGTLALTLGFTWLFAVRTRQDVDPAREVKPDAEGICWMPAECDIAPERIPRHLLVALPVALVPALAFGIADMKLIGGVWFAMVLVAAASLPMRDASRARLPKGERIGVRDRQLIVTHPEHGRQEFPLPAVEWNEMELRPTPELRILLVRGDVPLYHLPTLETELFPKLNLMRRLGAQG